MTTQQKIIDCRTYLRVLYEMLSACEEARRQVAISREIDAVAAKLASLLVQ